MPLGNGRYLLGAYQVERPDEAAPGFPGFDNILYVAYLGGQSDGIGVKLPVLLYLLRPELLRVFSVLDIFGVEQVYRLLGYEGGGHRVQRVPETEAQGRIHTSAATVAVLPEPEEVNIEVNWDAETLSAVSVCTGPGYGTKLSEQDADDWVCEHEAQIWKELEYKADAAAACSAEDRAERMYFSPREPASD